MKTNEAFWVAAMEAFGIVFGVGLAILTATILCISSGYNWE